MLCCTAFSGTVQKEGRFKMVFLLILLFWGRHFHSFPICLSYILALCCSICLHLNDTSNTLKALCHVLSMFSSLCTASMLTSLTKAFLQDRELIRLPNFHQISADIFILDYPWGIYTHKETKYIFLSKLNSSCLAGNKEKSYTYYFWTPTLRK